MTNAHRHAEDPRNHLLDRSSADEYVVAMSQAVEAVATRLRSVNSPSSGVTPDLLEPDVRAVDLDLPLAGLGAALQEVERLYLDDAVWFHHPRYLAHLNCPVLLPAVAAEALVSAVNSSLDTWDQSAGATLIERYLVDWTVGRLGLGRLGDGVFTSGGTQSNLQALLMARDTTLRRLAEAGLPADSSRLRVLVSEVGHFSVTTAAEVLGLGSDAVVTVGCDERRRMRPDLLAGRLQELADQGLQPFAVVATAGTTDFGSIDPLPAIADLCALHQVWMHVDAAYGCGLLVSRRRSLLDGVERADSVTVDFHKSFFQPVSSSAVLVRDRAVLEHVTHHADYLNPRRAAEARIPNQVDKSLQTTRRFDALKLWLTLRVMGPDAVGELFDRVVDLADEAWALLVTDPRFEVVTRPTLSAVVFRHVGDGTLDDDELDRVNLAVREAVAASGAAMVAGTTVEGRHYLKLTLLNPRTTVDDVAEVLELLAAHGQRLTVAAPRPTVRDLEGAMPR